MNISVIAVGNIKEKFFKDAAAEYIKRLSRFGKISIIEVKECRKNALMQDVEAEGADIIKKIKKNNFVIALCVEGEQKTSEELSDIIKTAGINGCGEITFIIGGSNGLSDEVKRLADMRLSFSKMTFPHQLMRVILLEQVYRGFKILNNENYHK